MFTKIKTLAHCETLCEECTRMLDAGGISRQVPDWGEDTVTLDMVRGRAPAPQATRCTWCGPESRWLSERMIALLPVGDRRMLYDQIASHAGNAKRGRDAWGVKVCKGPTPHHPRLLAMLGRLSAILA